ncbi:MAG: hypothetical protein VX910_08285 [Candidatus Latescibacterota bacterium]|nr:hypothetical protein [Candidatus Latescibacterota bacterium]
MKNKTVTAFLSILIAGFLVACNNANTPNNENSNPTTSANHNDGDHDHDHDHEHEDEDHDHEHDEIALGNHDIGGMQVEAAQGHGNVEPGKEGHLVIKLPYNDNGETTVRTWIGTEDRTLFSVGKGEYGPSHDDYDIHAVAPDPLPDGAKWWVEIEKPDGSKAVGSLPFQ